MEEREVIQILGQYRHDLLNQLQIVQGYLSMGKTEKVQSKITDYIQRLDVERKLVNLNAPIFALHLIQFDSLHTNFRLTYDIRTENRNLAHIDKQLLAYFQQIMAEIDNTSDKNELCGVHLQMNEVASESIIELVFMIMSDSHDPEKRFERLEDNNIDAAVSTTGDGITFTCKVQF